MKELTRAEEQVMQVMWKLCTANVKQILEEMPEPVPAVTTVSTIVRILDKKGFVGHEKQGRGHVYFPVVSREDYRHNLVKSVIKRFYDDEIKKFATFFSDTDLNERELALMKREIDAQLRSRRNRQPTLF